MSERLVSFGENVVALGFDIDQRLDAWSAPRVKMAGIVRVAHPNVV